MAEKKSFVMYASWEKAISKMTNEQAGQLLKAIYEYQSNPNACPEDMGVSFVFEIIKEKMDEDSAKYQKACDSRAEAGRKGNEKRWGKENESQNIANAINESQNIANAINESQNIANIADSESDSESDYDYDTESDNESENDNDSGKEKKKKEKPLKRLPSRRTARKSKAEQNEELFTQLSGGRYSDAVTQKIMEWMRYKGNGKGDEYEETGMRSLLSILDAMLREHGEDAVLAEITDAMGNGWKGIQWGRLNRSRGRQGPQKSTYSDLREAW